MDRVFLGGRDLAIRVKVISDEACGEPPRGRAGRSPFLTAAVACMAVALSLACTDARGLPSPGADPPLVTVLEDGSVALFDGRVVPPMPDLLGVREQYKVRLQWLEEKHRGLLPMMRQHGIAMWIVVNQEFHNDPVTPYLAPPMHYIQARGVKVFVDGGAQGLLCYSDYWNPRAHAEDYRRFFEPLPMPPGHEGPPSTEAGLRHVVDRHRPSAIALNYRGRRGQDSGLTHDGYQFLADVLGPEARFVPAAPLVEDYLDTRLPGELEHARALFLATDVLAQRALSNEVIVPGVTKAVDVKWWFEQQVANLGAAARVTWDIHTAVQRFDPTTAAMIPYQHPAPDDYVFQPGDIIHIDLGFRYVGLESDWQKVGYVLREGETDVPSGLKLALSNANRVHRAFAEVPRPRMTGWEATRAIVQDLSGVEFRPSLYSHPLGNHVHALGPSIDAREMRPSRPDVDSPLREGSYRSVEFSATTPVPEYGGAEVVIPMEDGAYLTEHGYVYFQPYQSEWYLIR